MPKVKKEVFFAGKKMQSLNTLANSISGRDIDPRYETQLGWESEPSFRSTNIQREISMSSGFEVEGEGGTHAGRSVRSEEKSFGKNEGTRPVASGRVRQICTKSQEKVDLGSGQACGGDRRSGSVCGSEPELGRAQVLGVGS